MQINEAPTYAAHLHYARKERHRRIEMAAARLRASKIEPVAPPVVADRSPGWFSIVREIEPVTAQLIQRVACEFYGVARNEMLSGRRSIEAVHPRQVAMYLARVMTLKSFPEIGKVFGRDHTTILHGSRKIEQRLAVDAALRDEVEQIRHLIEARTA